MLKQVLIEWYKWLDTNLGIPLDLIVYLRTSPQVFFFTVTAHI